MHDVVVVYDAIEKGETKKFQNLIEPIIFIHILQCELVLEIE